GGPHECATMDLRSRTGRGGRRTWRAGRTACTTDIPPPAQAAMGAARRGVRPGVVSAVRGDRRGRLAAVRQQFQAEQVTAPGAAGTQCGLARRLLWRP